ncbi:MAG: thiamine diphosphokinase [Clostridia bacterium]|nr:thiamine diphosphokinase [Clostridia bacterium]
MKICHVVGAGDFAPHLLKTGKDDLIIAADAGYDHLRRAKITPHLYIGDGDSLGFTPEGIETVLLPTVKDDTDIHAAVKVGLSRGFRTFYIYGALGGKRFSHSLANLQVLSFLDQNGATGILIDENYSVFLLNKGVHTFDFEKGYFSLFDFEGGAKVSVKGAKYPLEEASLPPFATLGISNEGEKNTTVTVHLGSVFVVREP